jgi:cytochrome c oxidase cbb3-type subunit 3
MKKTILLVSLLTINTPLIAGEAGNSYECKKREACLTDGAEVFHYRCALCHGNDGLGEGILPLSISNYPNTNLLEPRFGKSLRSITRIIRKGGKLKKVNDEMPPWEDELSRTELGSVAMFSEFLHRDFDAALVMLKEQAQNITPTKRIGRAIFLGRCALCHGKKGKGDGKMARIIKNPPPFNLTQSRIDGQYLRDIISKGGEAMGRSPKMPPWGKDLNDKEIESVIIYLKTLRK